MSTKLSSATALHEVRAASASGALGVSQGGPQAELGAKVTANAQDGSTRVLYYVDAAGDAITASGPLYQPEATDVAVTVPEGSGDQTWAYVQVGAVAITRGETVALVNVAPAIVSGFPVPRHTSYGGVLTGTAVAANMIAGVAQHNIPALHFGWILVKGVGIAKLDVTVAAGEELVAAAAGAFAGIVAPLSGGLGVALVAGVAATGAVKLDI